METLEDNFISLLEQGKYLQAYELSKQLTTKQLSSALKLRVQQCEMTVLTQQKCRKILDCERDKKWSTSVIDENATIHSKVEGSQISLWMEGKLKIDLFNLTAIVYQTDQYQNWLPFCQTSVEMASPTKCSKVVNLSFKIPFLSDRASFIYGAAIDLLMEEGVIGLAVYQVTANPAFEEMLGKQLRLKKGEVSLKVAYCYAEAKIEDGLVKFRAIGCVDVQLPIVPSAFVSLVVKVLGKLICQKFMEMTRSLEGTEWQKAVEEDKRGFYKFVRKLIGFFE